MRPLQKLVAGRQKAVARKQKTGDSSKLLPTAYRLLSAAKSRSAGLPTGNCLLPSAYRFLLSGISCLLSTVFCLLFLSSCAYLQTPPFEGRVLDQEKTQPLTIARISLACVAEKPAGGFFALENHWTVSDGEGYFFLEAYNQLFWDPYVFSRVKEIRLLVYAPAYRYQELTFPTEEARYGGLLDPFKPFAVKVNLAALPAADEKVFLDELRKLRALLEAHGERLYLPDPDFLNAAEYEFIRRFPQSREAQLNYLTIAKRTYHKRKDPAAAILVYQEYLAKYPDGFLRREVKDEIQRLSRTTRDKSR